MDKQLIISIGREFGSGGHTLANILAEKFGLEIYDKNILQEIANEKNVHVSNFEKYDERPRNYFFTRSVRGHSNSMEENLANMQFEFLRKKAAEGKSFIVVGRCAEHVLKDYPAMVSIFVLGDWEHKVKHVMEMYDVSANEAENIIYREDRKRKYYHNSYCKGKWGDSRNYDLSVNSSKLGEEETAEILYDYIMKRQKAR